MYWLPECLDYVTLGTNWKFLVRHAFLCIRLLNPISDFDFTSANCITSKNHFQFVTLHSFSFRLLISTGNFLSSLHFTPNRIALLNTKYQKKKKKNVSLISRKSNTLLWLSNPISAFKYDSSEFYYLKKKPLYSLSFQKYSFRFLYLIFQWSFNF